MGRVLPPPQLLLLLLLLLLLVSLSPGGAQSPNLALDCNAVLIVVKKLQKQIISSKQFTWSEAFSNSSLFVKPESDFEGVRLNVQSNDSTNHHQTVLFPAEECLPRNGKWLQFDTGIRKRRKRHVLYASCGKSRKGYTISVLQGVHTLSVEAHGSSRWIKGFLPKGCDVILPSTSENEQLATSKKSSSSATTTTTTFSSGTQERMIIIASTAGVVVFVVMVVVIVCRKWNSMVSRIKARFQSQPTVPRCHLQFTTGQGLTVDQDNEGFYYDIMPNGTARRVMVSQPAQSQPEVPNHHLQFTTGQGYTPDQDEEAVYYEILPNLTERRVIMSRPAHDSEEPLYSDIMPELDVQPRSPFYENVLLHGGAAIPHGRLEAQGVSVSHIHGTVL
ncbi:uncharacterized protein LOC135110945 [Scylla paramamosain]|uniref:uncharacterized protein LOC135110945 n=1 Tax=Scylla paramamosain TaxID=85552 RepID=UPI003082F40B